MRIWLAYKFRGADMQELRSNLENIITLLSHKGHEIKTMIKDIQGWDPDCMPKTEAVKRAYTLMDTCDMALCIYHAPDPSEGRGWDTGYFAGRNKPTVMAIKKDIQNPFTEALFSQNPANRQAGLPSIIRYDAFTDIYDSIPADPKGL
ncbi:hypothetical protein ACFL3V_05240 [Nanoarchaeota archaeon]